MPVPLRRCIGIRSWSSCLMRAGQTVKARRAPRHRTGTLDDMQSCAAMHNVDCRLVMTLVVICSRMMEGGGVVLVLQTITPWHADVAD
eukprot:34835-Eustigmatos_ZCMA.PRE.1